MILTLPKRSVAHRLSALSAVCLMTAIPIAALAAEEDDDVIRFVAEDFPASTLNAKSGANGLENGPKKSKGQIANDLLNYIKPKWNPDQKFVGTKITAYITVDKNGNVISVITNAKDPALSNSLITDIKQASPLTPIAGSGYTKLAFTFIVS